MSVAIVVPPLGESVSEATIAKWFKQPGDAVKVDELLLELETEKVTLEVNATAEGVLESIDAAEDATVTVGQVVGKIKAGSAPASASTPPSASVAPKETAPVVAEPTTSAPVTPVATEKKVDPATTMPPSVQKLVTENNLNPANIPATGKDGRINKGDVLNALSNPVSTQTTAPSPT
jgi:2-oxoglutarate dehydrogenase E2 component (dihydrolipoamide succinyltransferase)